MYATQARPMILERLGDALGRVAQAVAIRVVAGPTQHRTHGSLDFRAAGAIVGLIHGGLFVLLLQGVL
jgi:hypothetical protein